MDYFITRTENIENINDRRVVLEDTIMQKGRLVTAGSKHLGNFVSPIQATVADRLENAGYTIVGTTSIDEFGLSGLFADCEPEINGAIKALKNDEADFALCNDYTGKTEREAAKNGFYYIHPTYGTVSRYGLISAAASIDQVGIICKNPQAGYELLANIAGYDENDGAFFTSEINPENIEKTPEKLRFAVPTNVFESDISDVKTITNEYIQNADFIEIRLEYIEVYEQVMQILCFAEISNNITRYDGIKFGYRTADFTDLQELYEKTRTEAFGSEAKLVAILGAYVLSNENYDKLYDKAMRIRKMIKESLGFENYDVIVLPADLPFAANNVPRLALSALSRLCGLPSLTLPVNETGITLVANAGYDDVLRKITNH